MKLVAILRVKNEILYIRKCLERLSELVDEIIVLDNGSTDGTLDVYRDFRKLIQLLHTEGFDEGRDKIMLLEAAKKRDPDWILWLDGDEIFESSLTREILNNYMKSKYNRVFFRMCHFWLSEKYYRIDGKYFLYTLHPLKSMWKNVDVAYFREKNIHSGDIFGVPKPYYVSPYRIKHYGYADEEKMKKKYRLYNEIDKTMTRSYEHLNPQVKTIRIPYFEFKSKIINTIFIYLYKYITSFLQIAVSVYKKIQILFH